MSEGCLKHCTMLFGVGFFFHSLMLGDSLFCEPQCYVKTFDGEMKDYFVPIFNALYLYVLLNNMTMMISSR